MHTQMHIHQKSEHSDPLQDNAVWCAVTLSPIQLIDMQRITSL